MSRMIALAAAGALFLAGGVAGCGSDDSSSDGSGTDGSGTVDGTEAADGADGTDGAPDFAAAQKVYATYCTPCHEGAGCSGDTCFVSAHGDAIKDSTKCANSTVAECTVERIKDGSMPLNSKTVSADDLATLEAWVNAGSPE